MRLSVQTGLLACRSSYKNTFSVEKAITDYMHDHQTIQEWELTNRVNNMRSMAARAESEQWRLDEYAEDNPAMCRRAKEITSVLDVSSPAKSRRRLGQMLRERPAWS